MLAGMQPSDAARFQAEFFARNPSLVPVLALLEGVPGAFFFVKDRQCRYVKASPGTLTTYDLAREEDLVGRRAQEFFPPLLAEAYETEDRQVFETGEPVRHRVWLVPHIRGTPRWFVSSKTPLRGLTGEVIGLAGLMFPIATPEAQRAHFRELERVIAHLEHRYHEDVSVAGLAAVAGLSVPQFNRRFRQLLRLSPMQYVESLRMQEAQRRLATGGESLVEIALAAGFCDQSHFTKRFRKSVGMTPLAYRKRYRRPG